MAFSTLNLKHPEFEVTKEVPVGFSWTILFFGFFPPLFRGDFKWGLIMLIAALFTSFISSLIFMFIYNKIYLKSLLEMGYTSIDSEEVLTPIEAKLTMKIPRKS
jgi:hypothetical protein|tara:strand:- start:315 stop:626 length:312 start_codon:yes stop_codon:yes gene_type:complete